MRRERASGVKGRSKTEDVIMVAVTMFGWGVRGRHGIVFIRLLGAIVKLIA